MHVNCVNRLSCENNFVSNPFNFVVSEQVSSGIHNNSLIVCSSNNGLITNSCKGYKVKVLRHNSPAHIIPDFKFYTFSTFLKKKSAR